VSCILRRVEVRLEIDSGHQFPCTDDLTVWVCGFNLPQQWWSLLNHFYTAQSHSGKKCQLTDLCFCNKIKWCPISSTPAHWQRLNDALAQLHYADDDAAILLTMKEEIGTLRSAILVDVQSGYCAAAVQQCTSVMVIWRSLNRGQCFRPWWVVNIASMLQQSSVSQMNTAAHVKSSRLFRCCCRATRPTLASLIRGSLARLQSTLPTTVRWVRVLTASLQYVPTWLI